MTELKPCPFCGGEARLVKTPDFYHVECCNKSRECNVAPMTDYALSAREAISAWNNRPNPWHTGTPTEKGRYLVSNGYDESISYFDGKAFIKDFLAFPNVGAIVKWQKIEETE